MREVPSAFPKNSPSDLRFNLPTTRKLCKLSDVIYLIKHKRRDRLFSDNNGRGSLRLMRAILDDMGENNIVNQSSVNYRYIMELRPGPVGQSYFIAEDRAKFK